MELFVMFLPYLKQAVNLIIKKKGCLTKNEKMKK